MSLVGPRPLVTDEDAQVFGLDRSRLHLTPGMTGPWQILGARVPMQEMVGIDYLYVANWSLWLDFKVLLRTVRHVARTRQRLGHAAHKVGGAVSHATAPRPRHRSGSGITSTSPRELRTSTRIARTTGR